ncbi:MAG: hypothetical protein ACI85F_001643 [Bacteroidia bacterium]|jgi:hypothetical protein
MLNAVFGNWPRTAFYSSARGAASRGRGLLGKEVHHAPIHLGENHIHLPLSEGTYLYRLIRVDESLIYNGQLVIINE